MQGFLEHLQGIEISSPLLERVTLIDTPGIIENRRQQQRGYPFTDVIRWFVKRADLIVIVFDPTKLDVGTELEQLFRKLKGREGQIRLVLNKADTLAQHELMHVYGALFWNLAPLINVTEPPRVYTGSFWGKPYQPLSNIDLFRIEEQLLLQDLHNTVTYQLNKRVVFIRQHAIRVQIHALMVDAYLAAFDSHYSILGDSEALLAKILNNPEHYYVLQAVQAIPSVSKFDIPDKQLYKNFFSIHALNKYKRLHKHCGYFTGCPAEQILDAIQNMLPTLLQNIEHKENVCTKDICN